MSNVTHDILWISANFWLLISLNNAHFIVLCIHAFCSTMITIIKHHWVFTKIFHTNLKSKSLSKCKNVYLLSHHGFPIWGNFKNLNLLKDVIYSFNIRRSWKLFETKIVSMHLPDQSKSFTIQAIFTVMHNDEHHKDLFEIFSPESREIASILKIVVIQTNQSNFYCNV